MKDENGNIIGGIECFEDITERIKMEKKLIEQIPGMDACEVTRKIRATEAAGKHTKIIVMTASAVQEDQEKCLQAGMDDCISRPIQIENLFDMINRYTGWSSV